MQTTPIAIDERLRLRLPETYQILSRANLTVHPYVYKVVLSGSRGLAGGFRPDSDIDLSLLVDGERLEEENDRSAVLRKILETTLSNWRSRVELDTAAVFAIKGCGLRCLDKEAYDDTLCKAGGTGCIGLFKIQRGFNGYVPPAGIEIRRVYPLIAVWERARPVI